MTEEYLALSSIKEKATIYRLKEVNENELLLTEYVKFLIGQTRNEHFVIRKSDFAQTHELHQKTLAICSFDEYANQDEDAMKVVANDILQKSQYNEIISQHCDPISEEKYHKDPRYHYFIKCKQYITLALPLISKVVNK